MRPSSVEITQLCPTHASSLARFFSALREFGADEFFHPHSLLPSAATEVASYIGKDLYFVMLDGGEVIAYGMLRGWDEGYEIPSLGIAVAPDSIGQGVGRTMMFFLHLAARRAKAKEVRLRVDSKNTRAIGLYRSLGYVMEQSPEPHLLVGHLKLQ
jgi:ribosomal-protein-alanine N-acetyltransferase